jgi:hypothetical protein
LKKNNESISDLNEDAKVKELCNKSKVKQENRKEQKKKKKGKAENITCEDGRERNKMNMKQGEEKRSITRGIELKNH